VNHRNAYLELTSRAAAQIYAFKGTIAHLHTFQLGAIVAVSKALAQQFCCPPWHDGTKNNLSLGMSLFVRNRDSSEQSNDSGWGCMQFRGHSNHFSEMQLERCGVMYHKSTPVLCCNGSYWYVYV
jgi:hypothetical protein